MLRVYVHCTVRLSQIKDSRPDTTVQRYKFTFIQKVGYLSGVYSTPVGAFDLFNKVKRLVTPPLERNI